MKTKNIVFLASALLLVSCKASQATNSTTTTGLKNAAAAEASKTTVRYALAGDVYFERKYDGKTVMKADVDNINMEANVRNLSGGILKASSNDYKNATIYADGSVGYLDFHSFTGEGKEFASFSAYNGNANAYLNGGNLYCDLSNLDLSKAKWNDLTAANAPSKIKLESVLDAFSFQGIGFSGFDFSSEEIESYILPMFTFSTSGSAETASIKITQEQISNTYVSISLANWTKNTMPSVPKDMQDTALIAAKNRFQDDIASIVPSFSMELGLTYDSTGLYNANVKLDATISPDGADATKDQNQKTVVDYKIDLSLNSRSNPAVPYINTSEYTTVRYR